MNGIVFFRSAGLSRIVSFYVDRLHCTVWREQPGCTILRGGDLLVGFCHGESTETQGVITFFYDDREEVDGAYRELSDVADGAPRHNPAYRIYHFYGRDPDGRAFEIQSFDESPEGSAPAS